VTARSDGSEGARQRVADALRRFRTAATRVGKKVADFQARVLLTVFYFIVFAPFAIAVRLASDPLGIKARGRQGWQAMREAAGTAMDRATKQF
jgi:hypothetical protein